ncbi:Sucraseferredoxin family protein [Alloactinosynnema sp. L-07]|uniref:sucrase ferredoxin n=1 Tax=Alloactinosynnema sp. L-07 TaxID=1653480 RepID=UPI00065F034D|nr:sucrase ferredoxin [Alloactinosynnema sp. L-07]CRK59518.1 Sucraseferredoxin family protein [Alloactinosynnema sp. L-07]
MIRERCSDGCLRRGDLIGASAPPVRRWVLIEQPGPWGADALWESDLPASIAASVTAQAAEVGARVLLIRRPGRTPPGPRRYAVVDARAERLWWNEFTDPADLSDLSVAAPRGEPSTEPAYLVCAHGKHDTCCAIRGRPVAAALAAARPGQVWECSHVGGDRYSANLLALPHGVYFGQVPANQAVAVAADFEAGNLTLPYLRGRSTVPAPVQAAQQFARERSGDRRIDAFALVSVRRVAHEEWEVELVGARRLRVRAVFVRSDTPLTCSATVPAAIRHFELLED